MMDDLVEHCDVDIADCETRMSADHGYQLGPGKDYDDG